MTKRLSPKNKTRRKRLDPQPPRPATRRGPFIEALDSVVPSPEGAVVATFAGDDLDGFIDSYMPQTKAYLEDIQEDVDERLRAALPDRSSRSGFLEKIHLHLEDQVFTLAAQALETHFNKKARSLRAATATLHEKVQALYGDRSLIVELLLRKPNPAPPHFHAVSQSGTELLMAPHGQNVWFKLRTNDLRALLRPGHPKAATKRFLDEYQAEGAGVLKQTSGLDLFADPTSRPGRHRRRDHAMNGALVDLVDYLTQDGRAGDSKADRGPRLTPDGAFELVAFVFSNYFRFIGPHGKSPWEPDADALAKQYRRLKAGKT
jgi:hypothetical protein